jgi:hypothetical protein
MAVQIDVVKCRAPDPKQQQYHDMEREAPLCLRLAILYRVIWKGQDKGNHRTSVTGVRNGHSVCIVRGCLGKCVRE